MSQLTVYFDDPFWVGVFERVEDGHLETCRVVFGAEPKDYEVYAFILKHYAQLKFSRPLIVQEESAKRINPKRLQRKIKNALQNQGISTKAQEAIQLEREASKLERKIVSKEKKDTKKEMKFMMKQEKKKQKKKGH
ncbi:tRNA A37 threonylcarbamoyladenosine modification protein TsaB [Anaerosolibacter carboniphilus]|uniref:tRNA A37 threonylcarbamoyladenosine modification protein TsaB n=1 Tax=Anaerosolibacter carboniphilus TaxID=1417629 RepID=A0A841L149_9FIRM|nr:YjdF family protein [Anaerosolibacter carboniphilus]MBB6216095.1 tRNA A37 threonylcarbamoyladenosine modification protein TsaB [Anaerosolibacter carboniphilus]